MSSTSESEHRESAAERGPLGVVLTGGSSRHMGRDKAFLGPPAHPLVLRVAEALREVSGSEVVAVGGDGDRLRSLGLAWIADDRPGSGPLGGIATAARAHPNRPLVVAACDLPWIDAPAVARLWDEVRRGADAAVFVGPGGIAQWSLLALGAAAAEAVIERFDAGGRAVHAVLSGVATELRTPDLLRITDVDRPEDLPPDLVR